MRTIATWCFRHRRAVLGYWLGALVLATALARATGTDFTNTFTLPHTQSTAAYDLLRAVSPSSAGDTEEIVFEAPRGARVTDPAITRRVSSMLGRVAELPHVAEVRSPFSPGGALQVAPSGRIAFATVSFSVLAQNVTTKQAQQFVRVAESAGGHGLTVAVSGQIAEKALPPSLGGAGPGILLAGVVLLVVFGSLAAMALPLVSALASLGTAIGLIDMLSNVLKMPVFSTQLVLLIGLGVGIDYALFIVTRHRQGLIAGWDVERAAVNAVDTSGRAVLFAGIIVCIALLGMLALGVSFLYGLAVSASIGVAFTMLASLTLLPAMLGFLGEHVLSGRQRRRLRRDGPRVVGSGATGFWTRWAAFQSRRPLVAAAVAVVLIVLVALPFFSMRLGTSDEGNDPAGTTTRVAYDLLAKGFGPGVNGPLQVVVAGRGTLPRATLATLEAAIAARPDVAAVTPPRVLGVTAGRTVALLEVVPASAPQDAATTALIDGLRDTTVPRAISGSHLEVLIGGTTAIFVDFGRVLSSKLPLFIGLVVFLSFVLLGVVFRSIAIPITAAAMNVLSIGAAFGVLVAVFQQGTLGALFGVNRPGPIESFLPVMLFAILFGLSMDYEVFLLSRIHEEYLRLGDNRAAVRQGLAATGKTITAAALIMILVFGSFILGGERVIKEFGLGLAAGIFMDAVLIRMALVPAVMFLLGGTNWWFPSRLDRALPRFAVDPEVHHPSVAPLPEDDPALVR